MTHQRHHVHFPAVLMDGIEVAGGGGPSPAARFAENSCAEFVQQVCCSRIGEGREAAIADHLSGDSLLHLFHAVVEHLKIGVTVQIDEAGSDGNAGAIDHAAIGRRGEDAYLRDVIAVDQKRAWTGALSEPSKRRPLDKRSMINPESTRYLCQNREWIEPKYWSSRPSVPAPI